MEWYTQGGAIRCLMSAASCSLASHSFTYTGTLGLTALATSGGTVSQTFSDVVPGTYTVAETNPAPAKYALSVLGKCADTVRLPMVPLAEKTKTAVREAMVHAGLIN